ncbi:YjgF/Yer057p/UK114 family [Penicillium frequentans]|uniref:YjgF/Yer057p/UK114 family n=1 Tax=Penicillium frequentans TaxID=3151616 RepID=A0AAD6GL93_9EURO|nr:YjgF/Yer057p/UK114 family [Penicillium glabrum]
MRSLAPVAVRTNGAPSPPPFLSQGVLVGDFVFCSGQVGADPTTGTLVKGPIQNRTRQILQNLNAVLQATGCSLEDAVKVNIFLTDMADFAAVNEMYDTFFSGIKPVGCLAW